MTEFLKNVELNLFDWQVFPSVLSHNILESFDERPLLVGLQVTEELVIVLISQAGKNRHQTFSCRSEFNGLKTPIVPGVRPRSQLLSPKPLDQLGDRPSRHSHGGSKLAGICSDRLEGLPENNPFRDRHAFRFDFLREGVRNVV